MSKSRKDVHNASLYDGALVLFMHQVSGGTVQEPQPPFKETHTSPPIRFLLQHLRILRPLAQPHTPQGSPLEPIPRGHGQLMTPRPRRARDARIVDTVVDSPERFDTLIHHTLDLRLDRSVRFGEDGVDLGVSVGFFEPRL